MYRLARLIGKVVRFQHRGTHWWAAPRYQKQRNRSGLNNWLDCLASWYTPNFNSCILPRTCFSFKHIVTFQPCRHECTGNGTCRRIGDFHTDFNCECNRGFEGEQCETPRNACDQAKSEGKVCQNDGECRNGFDPFDYSCVCPHGWMGKHCETHDVSIVFKLRWKIKSPIGNCNLNRLLRSILIILHL